MSHVNAEIENTEIDTELASQQALEQADTDQATTEQPELTPEQAARDAAAAQMAKELGIDEDDADFDPTLGQPQPMTPEQEAAALAASQELLATPEGAEMAAVGAITFYEELIQEHGHEKFTMSDKKKEIGAKRLTPVIQKYAPQMLGLFGQYKHEVMAALWMGTLAYGSVKQVKALKAADLAEDKRLNPEKYETKESEQPEKEAA